MRAIAKDRAIGPFFGLVMTWFAIEYLRPEDYVKWIGVIRPGLIVLVILFLLWMIKADKSILKDRIIVLYLAFLAIGGVSVFWATNTYWAAQSNIFMISYLLGGVLPFIAFIDRAEAFRRFFSIWVIFNVAVGIFAILHKGKGSGSFLLDENDLALAMAIALPFAYYLALHGSRAPWFKGVFMTAAFVLVMAIIASFSRGGFLGLLAAAFGIVLFSRNKARNFVWVGIAAIVVVTTLSVVDVLGARSKHEQDLGTGLQAYIRAMGTIDNTQDSTRMQREYYWRRCWEMFRDNPVLGVGTSNFGWVVEDYEARDPEYGANRRMSGGRVAHSLYFTLLAEYGTTGTIIYLAMGIGVWNRLRRIRKRLEGRTGEDAELVVALSRAISAALLAFFVAGAFLTVLYYPHFWYLLGFTLGLERMAAKIAPDPVRKPLFRRGSSPASEPA